MLKIKLIVQRLGVVIVNNHESLSRFQLVISFKYKFVALRRRQRTKFQCLFYSLFAHNNTPDFKVINSISAVDLSILLPNSGRSTQPAKSLFIFTLKAVLLLHPAQ